MPWPSHGKTPWVLADFGKGVELFTLEEYLDTPGEHERVAVCPDLQTMCNAHAKYIGLAQKKKGMSERDLDRITSLLTRKSKVSVEDERVDLDKLLKGLL